MEGLFTVAQIASLVSGTVIGDAHLGIKNFARIESAEAGDITFLANPKYQSFLQTTRASAVLISECFVPKEGVGPVLIVVPDAYLAFTQILELYQKLQASVSKKGIHKKAVIETRHKIPKTAYVGAYTVIAKGAVVGENVLIYPQCYIGEDVEIGAGSIIYAGVQIYADTKIGARVIIHSGAVIGADGFGFAPQQGGSYKKIPQVGRVVIASDVEIGANATIDRAVMGTTQIEQGTKIDNLVMIAHNVEVGADTVIAAQTGVAGSTKIGSRSVIAGQVGISGHLTIGEGVTLGPKAGIVRSIAAGQTVWGYPGMEAKAFMRSHLLFKNLSQMEKRLRILEERLKE